jgi:chorismate synthase
MIRFSSAGESHGKSLTAILEGVPAGLPPVAEDVDHQLRRRMAGHGRGARMKVEADAAVERFSGDCLEEVRDNSQAYVARMNSRLERG